MQKRSCIMFCVVDASVTSWKKFSELFAFINYFYIFIYIYVQQHIVCSIYIWYISNLTQIHKFETELRNYIRAVNIIQYSLYVYFNIKELCWCLMMSYYMIIFYRFFFLHCYLKRIIFFNTSSFHSFNKYYTIIHLFINSYKIANVLFIN